MFMLTVHLLISWVTLERLPNLLNQVWLSLLQNGKSCCEDDKGKYLQSAHGSPEHRASNKYKLLVLLLLPPVPQMSIASYSSLFKLVFICFIHPRSKQKQFRVSLPVLNY